MESDIYDMSFLSLKETDIDRLLQQEKYPNGLVRYNLEQVKKIVELVYLPHQVEQWNKSVNGDEDATPLCHINDDEKPVVFEEALPGAMESVTKIYENYVKITKGEFYLHEFKMEHYHESCWISRKKFDGFVTKELQYNYSPIASESLEVVDWELYVPWEDGHMLNPGKKSKCHIDSKQFSETELKDFVKEKVKEHKIEAKLGFYGSRHNCRKFGLIPDNEYVDGAEELSDFIINFLREEMKGTTFTERAYDESMRKR